MPNARPRIQYDCSKCPGYCCSYPRIEVKNRDLTRLAKHFGLTLAQAEKKFTRWYKSDEGDERILRHHRDEIYGTICKFFDRDQRRCTIYAARPQVCREYPNGASCGYYGFIRFERKHQDDESFIPTI